MTLTKTKPRRPSLEHRKRSGLHHRHSHEYVKTYWPYLPVLAILGVGLISNSWLGNAHRSVLGYATDMSVQSLLQDTNWQRQANSESGLDLNAQLDNAAQAKANDMAARNYWSHDTPDGKTPWTFIVKAGYTYQAAGENLAYGFTSADDTVSGWMNSPEHRANILNANYRDVGFGIVNISDYQDTGPETLVVAMYGEPVRTSVTAQPVVSSPSIATAKPATRPAARPAASSPVATTTKPATKPVVNSDIVEPAQQRVSQFQLVASNVPMNTFALTTLGMAAAIFLIIRHSLAWRKALLYGESFVLRHPLLDVVAITLVSASIVLSSTAGLIR